MRLAKSNLTYRILQDDSKGMSKPRRQAEKTRLADAFDIVDMEGYAVASLAQKKGVPCSLYKIVTDFCSKTTLAEMRPKRADLASELFSLLRPLLEKRISAIPAETILLPVEP